MIIEGRINWARNLFTPSAPPGTNATPKYKCDIIVPKSDPGLAALMEKVKALIDSKLDGNKPTGNNWPFKDGDTMDGDHFDGCLVFSAKNAERIQVVDQSMQEVIDQTKIKSGDFCKFDVEPWAYSNVSKGISVSLNAVQLASEGDPIGRVRAKASDLFTPIAPSQKPASAGADNLDDFLNG